MDISDAILRSITRDNYRYGTIFSRANEITHMSRETFDRHLRNLVTDEYIIRTDKGKQKIEYKINQDAFNVIQGFREDINEIETQELFKKMLKSETDFSFLQTKDRDKMIKHLDELLHTTLIQQNLATLIIYDLHRGDKTALKKAVKGRESNDITIDLILKLIKKINPNIGELYSAFTFKLLAKEPKTLLDRNVISMMEQLGEKAKEKNLKRKKYH